VANRPFILVLVTLKYGQRLLSELRLLALLRRNEELSEPKRHRGRKLLEQLTQKEELRLLRAQRLKPEAKQPVQLQENDELKLRLKQKLLARQMQKCVVKVALKMKLYG
jgi:hypothetical protein